MKLQILSKGDIEKVHKASIKVLEKTGVQFLNNKALDYLEKYGCTVNRKTKIAKIPEAVVNEFMKKAIPDFPYYNRELKKIPKRVV